MTGDDLHRDGQQKLPRVLRVYEKRNELMLHKIILVIILDLVCIQNCNGQYK